MNNTDSKILRIAVPSIISNVTVPLLGIVDMAIAGHMGDAVYIAAVAVGSMIFNVIYWLCGFLRMGTSGMTSQALGRRDLKGVAMIMARGMSVALAIASAILVMQLPIGRLAIWMVGAEDSVSHMAWRYFCICVWGAPAMLSLYALTGWYVGMQNTRLPMMISIMQNVVNIIASFTFVYVFGMKVEGVAMGTVVAQYAGIIVSAWLWTRTYGARLFHRICWREIMEADALKRFFAVNRDIFLRTLFLVAVNFFFLSAGASYGAVVLAVNTLLMQLFTLFSYVMDGFAYAGEALCGRLYGAGNKAEFSRTIGRLFRWGIALSAVYTAVYAFGGEGFLSLLTDDAKVVGASSSYLLWAAAIPFCGMAAFVWDGVFIGVTATRGMLLSSAIAAISFFLVYALLHTTLQNHALWLAFLVFLAMRGGVQSFMYRKLRVVAS